MVTPLPKSHSLPAANKFRFRESSYRESSPLTTTLPASDTGQCQSHRNTEMWHSYCYKIGDPDRERCVTVSNCQSSCGKALVHTLRASGSGPGLTHRPAGSRLAQTLFPRTCNDDQDCSFNLTGLLKTVAVGVFVSLHQLERMRKLCAGQEQPKALRKDLTEIRQRLWPEPSNTHNSSFWLKLL